MEILKGIAAKCQLCPLAEGRKKPVFARYAGTVSKSVDVMICGMCPGVNENNTGIPFVGISGKILDSVIEQSINNNTIYITNLVKCFVNPGIILKNEWMNICIDYLTTQISLLTPKVIIGLGKDVCNYLLDTNIAIGKLRNKEHFYTGIHVKIPFISTYHPSYLARGGGVNHRDFDKVVQDFTIAKKYL